MSLRLGKSNNGSESKREDFGKIWTARGIARVYVWRRRTNKSALRRGEKGSLMRNGSGYRENGRLNCANHNKGSPGENHNQLFTLFISCLHTLVRSVAGNCSGLRAHEKSSWHFDFLRFLFFWGVQCSSSGLILPGRAKDNSSCRRYYT